MARDHFIPKAYLRHFTSGYLRGVSEGKLYAYSVTFERYRLVSINKHVGFEHNLYAEHPLDRDWNTYERSWPSVVDALRHRNHKAEIITDLLAFTAIQFCRVPAIMEVVAKRIAFANHRVIRTELDGKPVNGMLIKMVHTHQVLDFISDILPSIIDSARAEYHWEILHNTTIEHFLTNDQPCMWDISTGNVIFPISLDLALVGTYTEKRNISPSFKAIDATHDLVRQVNRSTVKNASRLIFSQHVTDELLRFFRENKKTPDLNPMSGGRSFSNTLE